MMSTDREYLKSYGEHAYALKRIGRSSYGPEEYLRAVDEARAAGDGERYANSVLGVDPDELLTGTEADDELMKAAERDLKSSGISLSDASYDQLAAALARVSS
jgi:hypothetical protein